MDKKLCQRYGFDAKAIRARLELIGLVSPDKALAECLQQQVILPNIDSIIDAFYQALARSEDFNLIIGQGYKIDDLKRTQKAFLLTLGLDFQERDYFEERLRVGQVHERVKVPLSLYLSAYMLLQQELIASIPEALKHPQQSYQELVNFILKITTLDMSLAIETYHKIKIQTLEHSLDRMMYQDEQLRRKVDTDALTGLASHAHVLEVLATALKQAHKKSQHLCVIMADLDHFKDVNDSHGHLVGDKVLQDVAARMRSATRDFDTAGRYGGEEFLIVLKNTTLERAQEVAERIRLRVAKEPVHIHGKQVKITISQGISMAAPDDSPESLIRRADDALYTAKAEGRNCVRLDHDSGLIA